MSDINCKNNTILVTGGAGYIGSHVCLELIEGGYDIVIIDSLENSTTYSIKAIENRYDIRIPFYHAKVQDSDILRSIFKHHDIFGVIHMAGYKSVKQSMLNPESYYDNNLMSTIHLLKAMNDAECRNLIFSSSATVYGNADGVCREDSPLSTLNPYGETKLIIEVILDYALNSDHESDQTYHVLKPELDKIENAQFILNVIANITNIARSDKWNFISLRYFNPIGAHESHIIGENPSGIPENLVPYIMKVMSGQLDKLTVFGDDYDTPDGTAIRDYIHVVDLAKAHVSAIEYLMDNHNHNHNHNHIGTHERFNIGTGTGYSVLEIIRAFESLIELRKRHGLDTNVDLNWTYGPRRDGDCALIYADSTKANDVLGWKPMLGINQMCEDAWLWWINNIRID